MMTTDVEAKSPRGLAAPGMPIGSPGVEGGQPAPDDVILFSAVASPRRGK